MSSTRKKVTYVSHLFWYVDEEVEREDMAEYQKIATKQMAVAAAELCFQ